MDTHGLPAVLGGLRHQRAGDAGRIDSNHRRPAEAREGRASEEDRGQSGSSDQHGRHLRARPGGRASALPSGSHSDAAPAFGRTRLRAVSTDHVEGSAAAARHSAAAASGDTAGGRNPHRTEEPRHDGDDRRAVRGRHRHDQRRLVRSVRSRRPSARRWS